MLREASEQRKKIVSILAFISIPLSGFVTDIYLPSFPAMAKEMMVSEKAIQLTLTCYLLSYGISQLFIGSILDSIGRYKPKIIALCFVLVSSILITMTDSIFVICVIRVLQGIAVSVLVIATRALFVDIHTPEKVKHYLSYFTIVWSCGPILAPFLGGYLEKMFNWHANFYFISFYAGILLIAELVLSGESIPEKKKLRLVENIKIYKEMLQHKTFIYGIFIQGLAYSIVMLFNITGPFLIEDTFHFNSVMIGYCTLILGFSWMIGGFIGKRRMHLPFNQSILTPMLFQFSIIVVLLIASYFIQNLAFLISFAFLIHICSGILFTSFFTSSMLTFPKNAGIAGGLMGGLVYIITSITTYIVSSTGTVTSQEGLSWRYLIFSGVLFVIVLLMRRLVRKSQIA